MGTFAFGRGGGIFYRGDLINEALSSHTKDCHLK
jgi:hypothetical protein